jgi:DNA polymerase-3 subunit gamma/tau
LQQIAKRLQALADFEDITAEPEALALIARSATGSLRDAESMLDQLAAANPKGITLDQVRATLGTIDTALVMDLLACLVASDVATGLALIDRALEQGADLRQFARQIVDHLRGMLLIKLEGQELLDVSTESLHVLENLAEQITTSGLIQAIKRFNQAEADSRGGWQPQLPLELAFVEAILHPANEKPKTSSPAPKSVNARDAQKVYEANFKSTGPSPTQESVPLDHKQAPSPIQESMPHAYVESMSLEQEPTPPVDLEQKTPGQDSWSPPLGLTLEFVQQHWRLVLENVRAHDTSVQALLNSARPIHVHAETVTLGVAHEFARSKLSQGRAKRLVEDVLSQVFKKSCQVELKLDAGAGETPSDGELPNVVTPAEVPRVEENLSKTDKTWADDPVVQAAKQMGAEVRRISEGRKE